MLPYRSWKGAALFLLLGTTPGLALAQGPASLVVDDFESGVSNWTRNDKVKANGGVVTLAEIVPTAPSGGAPGSKGAALVAFKTGRASWASISRPVDGAAWARIGAQRLTLWLDAGGEVTGVNLQLRARVPAAGGKTTELVFAPPRPVRLDITRWRKVVIPLSDFKGPKGEALAPYMAGVYQINFSQSGDWDSRFFSLDDIRVEGTGQPLTPAATPTPAPVPAKTPAPGSTGTQTPSTDAIRVSADFLKTTGSIPASANITVGGSYANSGASPMDASAAFRQALATLKPKFIKINAAELCDLTDSSGPSFDYSRLTAATVRARSWKAEPLISLSNPPEWGLDDRGYATFATGVAKALNRKGGPGARFFELATVDDTGNARAALAAYNAGYKALKTLSAQYRVGGYGAYSANQTLVTAMLQGAAGLDFLSVSFFGAVDGQPEDAALLTTAREIPDLKTVAGLLDKSKFAKAPIYVTSANLSAARNAGDSVPSDIRLVQGISATWWAQFLASGSRLGDQLFHNDAVNAEWGLLDTNAHAYPSYYVLWLWNTYFAGANRVVATSDRSDVFVAACNTATAHNLLLVNTTSSEQTAQVGIRGFPILREARMRIFDDPRRSVEFTALPKSPFQTIKLAPYAVAVLQFIEPPKKTR